MAASEHDSSFSQRLIETDEEVYDHYQADVGFRELIRTRPDLALKIVFFLVMATATDVAQLVVLGIRDAMQEKRK